MADYKFGRGKVYIAPIIAGQTPAMRYLGQTPGFSLSVDVEEQDLRSSDGPTSELLASVVTSVDVTGALECHNIDKDNQALFFSGETSDVSQTTGAISYSISNVQEGATYKIGRTDSTPMGFVDVVSVAVSGAVAGTDFTVDEALGLISIARDGAIETGDNITVTGNRAARTITRVTSGNKGKINCQIDFIADNASGENDRLFMPLATLSPTGDFSLQGEDFTSLNFNIKALKSATAERIYIDGQPVAAA